MGLLLILIIFVAIIIFTLSLVFFILRKSMGKMVSINSYFLGICISSLTYLISFFLFNKHWQGIINYTNNLLILYSITLFIPGVFGIIGVFLSPKEKILNTIGFAFAFSTILSGLISIVYLTLFAK